MQLEWGLRQGFELTCPASQRGGPGGLPAGSLLPVALFWSAPGCGAATPGSKLRADVCSRYGCTGEGRRVMNLQLFFHLVSLRGDSPYSCRVQVQLKAARSLQQGRAAPASSPRKGGERRLLHRVGTSCPLEWRQHVAGRRDSPAWVSARSQEGRETSLRV